MASLYLHQQSVRIGRGAESKWAAVLRKHPKRQCVRLAFNSVCDAAPCCFERCQISPNMWLVSHICSLCLLLCLPLAVVTIPMFRPDKNFLSTMEQVKIWLHNFIAFVKLYLHWLARLFPRLAQDLCKPAGNGRAH